MKYLLIGNPNCGKSTLFTSLSGAFAPVGNYPGVTVDCRTASLVDGHTLTDLPGTYSLRPASEEEAVTRQALAKACESRDADTAILNLVDATCPARGLYLTACLLTLGLPMAVMLSHTDEAERLGMTCDAASLSRLLGVPVYRGDARSRAALSKLLADMRDGRFSPPRPALPVPLPQVESGGNTCKTQPDMHACGDCGTFCGSFCVKSDLSSAGGSDSREEQAILLRYRAVDYLCSHVFRDFQDLSVTNNRPASGEKTGGRAFGPGKNASCVWADKLLMHRIWGYPLFILIAFVMIGGSYTLIGMPLSALVERLSETVTEALHLLLLPYVHPFWVRLLCDGVLGGIFSVLAFLPTVASLYLALSLLEDSGYLARAAFLFDRPMRLLGLSGRSFVPLLLGLGCSVPAVLAARTLSSRRDRILTLLLVPFLPCGAKIPVMAAFLTAFFPGRGWYLFPALYLLCITVGVLASGILSRSVFRGEAGRYLLELPPYRFPSPRHTFCLLTQRIKELFGRLFGVILLSSVVLFLLGALTVSLTPAESAGAPNSLLQVLGRWFAPLIRPLGLSDGGMAIALLCGLCAKEAILAALSQLSPLPGAALHAGLRALFQPDDAVVFLVFALLYTPCVASLATVRREAGWRVAAGFAVLPLLAAYGCAFLVRVGLNLF